MRAFHRLEIGGKLTVGFMSAAMVAVVIGGVGIWSLGQLNDATAKLYDRDLLGVSFIKEANVALIGMGREARSVLLSPTQDERLQAKKRLDTFVREVEENLSKGRGRVYTDKGKEQLGQFDHAFAAYQDTIDRGVALAESGDPAKIKAAYTLILAEGKEQGDRADAAMDALIEEKVSLAAKAAESAQAMYAQIRMTILGILIAGVLASLVLGRYIAGLVGKPLTLLTAAAERIALGDIDQTIQHVAADETGRLADAFREMTTYINGVSACAESLSKGNLTVRLIPRSERDILSHNFNTAGQALQHLVERISRNAVALSSASQQLIAIATQMSANAAQTTTEAKTVAAVAQQLNQNVQIVAGSAEEMNASIKEIAKSANEASKVASDAARMAQTTNGTVTQLGDSSTEVGNIIKVITAIAQQTKLLALNATIEAAGAGDAGKGFAVVASEVKELAKETAKATEDISHRIEAIQSDTRNAVDAIGTITVTIDQINGIQLTTSSAVEQQAATTAEIGRNVTQAATGTSEIARSIAEVAKASESTSAGADDAQKAAGSLAQMALDLQQLIGQFTFA